MKVFVYGTLKRGFGNNGVLRDARFLCEDITRDSFLMLDAGFPVLMEERSDQAKPATGEVFEIPDDQHGRDILRGLDRLEGEGRMYHRQVRMTKGGHMVSVYLGDTDCWSRHDRNVENSRRVTVTEDTYTYVND